TVGVRDEGEPKRGRGFRGSYSLAILLEGRHYGRSAILEGRHFFRRAPCWRPSAPIGAILGRQKGAFPFFGLQNQGGSGKGRHFLLVGPWPHWPHRPARH